MSAGAVDLTGEADVALEAVVSVSSNRAVVQITIEQEALGVVLVGNVTASTSGTNEAGRAPPQVEAVLDAEYALYVGSLDANKFGYHTLNGGKLVGALLTTPSERSNSQAEGQIVDQGAGAVVHSLVLRAVRGGHLNAPEKIVQSESRFAHHTILAAGFHYQTIVFSLESLCTLGVSNRAVGHKSKSETRGTLAATVKPCLGSSCSGAVGNGGASRSRSYHPVDSGSVRFGETRQASQALVDSRRDLEYGSAILNRRGG